MKLPENLTREEAEAFAKVCHLFFDEIPVPEDELPRTVVLDLNYADSKRQICFIIWANKPVQGPEKEISGRSEQ